MNSVLITTLYKQGGGRIATQNLIDSYQFDKVLYINVDSKFKFLLSLFKTCFFVFNKSIKYVILDGLPSYLISLFCLKKIIVINHNSEFIRFKSLKKLIAFYLQNIANKKAEISIFFSQADKNNFGEVDDAIVWPFAKKKIDISDVEEYQNFKFIIPSNLNYYPNIHGLNYFYKYYRKNFVGKIIITSQCCEINDNKLQKKISYYNDKIVSLGYSDYISLISNKTVIIPIFSGSGVQIKAIEAFYYSNDVYSTDFIKMSSYKFKSFKSFESKKNNDYESIFRKVFR